MSKIVKNFKGFLVMMRAKTSYGPVTLTLSSDFLILVFMRHHVEVKVHLALMGLIYHYSKKGSYFMKFSTLVFIETIKV